MVSQHCPRLKKSWNLHYFSFFLKSPQMHAATLLLWNGKTYSTLFTALQGQTVQCLRNKVLSEKLKMKKNAEYLRNQNQGLLNNLSTASQRLLFAKHRRPSRWCKGLLSHCHPICSLYSTISLNHISTPNISWTATELHAFLCKDTLKSYCSQSSFYLSSFEETSRGIIVSHNAGTQLVHHPSGFNQALQKGNTE